MYRDVTGLFPEIAADCKKQKRKRPASGPFVVYLAGPVRFELTMGFPTPVFKTGAFNRSATDPNSVQA